MNTLPELRRQVGRCAETTTALNQQAAAALLARSVEPVYATDDQSECREYIWGATGTHRFDVGCACEALRFSHFERRVGGISVNFVDLECNGGFRIAKTGPSSRYAFQFVVDGTCQLEGIFGRLIVRPGDVFILDPEQLTREFWPTTCRQFVVYVESKFIEQTVADEIHRGLKRPVIFDPMGRDPGILSWLYHLASAPGPQGPEQSVLANRRVVRSVEHTLATMLLLGFHHSESPDYCRDEKGPVPYYIKRAEEYIRSHARDDISIDRIAAAGGVSARTMFYGFKHWRSTTPMAHVRNIRLDLARAALERARMEGGTVSHAALDAGFTNFSQFSKIYKARFGESPSVTLRAC
jgi:AraC-like DNA-binding protein